MLGEETAAITNIFKELNIEEEEDEEEEGDKKGDNNIQSENIPDIGGYESYGNSPPSGYLGAECPSPSCSIDIPISNDKEKKRDLHMSCENMPRLQKASSVPQIHSGSPRRKKTSEANPLPDPMILGNLMQENQIMKNNLLKLKEKNIEIIAINHDWDKSYNTLVTQHTELQKQFQKNNEQLNGEIAKKEEEKNRMKAKLERFFNEGSLDEKALLAEEKEEKNKILKREQAAIQTAKEFQMKCQHLDHICRQTTQQKAHLEQQKAHLERELQRLSLCMENEQQHKNFAGINVSNDSPTQNQQNYNADVNEMELLRQQLQMYVEDFDAEKSEKQRLLTENEEVKRKLTSMLDENEHLKTQLQIYEKDFSREREKRIQLMRKTNPTSRSVMTSSFGGGSSITQDEVQRKRHDLNSDRLDNIEPPNVNTWSNGGFSGTCISNNLPPYPQSPAYTQINQSLPRSAPPYTYSKMDKLFNEETMQARGILSRSIIEKDDNCVIATSNNPTNSTNSWSYFGP